VKGPPRVLIARAGPARAWKGKRVSAVVVKGSRPVAAHSHRMSHPPNASLPHDVRRGDVSVASEKRVLT